MALDYETLDLTTLDGGTLGPQDLDDRVVLFVNVASRCGLTPQYAGLASLSKQDDRLVVVGVPCNQFAGQEPGSADEIQAFCSTTYGVDFPLLAKQDVNGEGRSSLYRYLVDSPAGGGDDIQWNFEKFVVGRTGDVVARFDPTTTPEDPALLAAIGDALEA